MASIFPKYLSIDDFYEFAQHPEYKGRHLELIGGEVVETPTNTYASVFAVRIATHIMQL